ncbi:hypothetical protein T484DRAFT_1925105, partial [Baffinella frigidus]
EMEQPASQRASLQLDVCPPQRSRSRRPFPAAVVAVVAGLAVVQLLSGAPGVCGNVLKRNEAALRSEGHTYAEPGQILETLQEQEQYPPAEAPPEYAYAPAAAPAPAPAYEGYAQQQPQAQQQAAPSTYAAPEAAPAYASAPLAGPPQEQVGPPLVTDESEAEAQDLFPGKEVDSLSHRHQIRLAALRRQQAQYGSTSATVFVTSFLAMVAAVIVGFYLAEKSWIARQQVIVLD